MQYTFVTGSVEEVAAEIKGTDTFSFDLETTGLNSLDSRILLAQFGFQNGKNFVVNIHNANFTDLLWALKDSRYTKIIHNAKFEQKFIQYHYNTEIRNVFDTMLAEQVIMSTAIMSSLADVVFKYTGEVLDKEQQTSFVGMRPQEMFTSEQLHYAAKDVEVMFPVYEAQKAALEESGQTFIAQVEFDLAGVVASMELEGIPVDSEKWREHLADYREKHIKSKEGLLNLIFDGDIYDEQSTAFEPVLKKFNVNSTKQLAEVLIKAGIELPLTPKGNYKTDVRTLERINHPIPKSIIEYRKNEKVLSTYGESFISHIHPFTNRIHPDFHQIGTETGRFSCKEPNVQNIPEEFRGCVGNIDNYNIVGADYANIELRIIAELSNDEALLKAFALGDDPHKSTAAIMFNIPIEDVTKDQRFIAKTINFGLTYGMGAPKLQDMLNRGKEKKDQLSISKVYGIVNKYKETYHGVTKYFAQSGVRAFNSGVSSTISGRKRYFNRPSGVDEESFRIQAGAIRRQGGNAPIQGTNADITKLAMLSVHEDLKLYGFQAKIIVQVHDEIVVLAHKNHSTAVKDVVKESMLNAAQQVLKAVPVKVDTYIADIWIK